MILVTDFSMQGICKVNRYMSFLRSKQMGFLNLLSSDRIQEPLISNQLCLRSQFTTVPVDSIVTDHIFGKNMAEIDIYFNRKVRQWLLNFFFIYQFWLLNLMMLVCGYLHSVFLLID